MRKRQAEYTCQLIRKNLAQLLAWSFPATCGGVQAGQVAPLESVQKGWRELMQAATLSQGRLLLSQILRQLEGGDPADTLPSLTVSTC